VYLAEKNGEKYAIKIPSLEVTETLTKDDIEKFLREAQTWKILSKKYPDDIVYVEEYDTNPIPWIAMEYCDYSLRTLLKSGPLPLDRAIAIGIKIAEALSKIHHHGIVHMDIKPENILFKNDIPKISDFGIAVMLLKVSATVSKYPGTPLYSAPEQIYPKKFGGVDWRTDIWQFGCLLYEMVEGKPPISSFLSPLELIAKITQGELEPMEHSPEWLQKIILACLKKKKEDRPLDIGIVVESLKRHASIVSPRPIEYGSPIHRAKEYEPTYEEISSGPLGSIEKLLRQMKVVTVGILAKKLDISKEDVETYLALSEYAVPSKRPGVYYSIDHINKVKEKLVNNPKIIVSDIEIKKLKILKEDLEEILKDSAVPSLRSGMWYGRNYWEQRVSNILDTLRTKGWILTSEVEGLEKEDLIALLKKHAERSPSNSNLWYRKGLLNNVRKYLSKLNLDGKSIDTIVKMVKIHPEDTKLIIQKLGYKIIDGKIKKIVKVDEILKSLSNNLGIDTNAVKRRIMARDGRIFGIDLSGLGIASVDLMVLAVYPTIEEIYLNYNKLEEIDLARLPLSKRLRILGLAGNRIREIDLSPLSICQRLEELSLSNNIIERIDLSPLSHCEYLRWLELSGNRLNTIDLSPLSDCVKLECLWLDMNNLEYVDLSPLSNCRNLRVLSISGNEIEELDLSPLAECRNLEELWICISTLDSIDLSPLRRMEGLRIYADPNTELVGAKLRESNRFATYVEYRLE